MQKISKIDKIYKARDSRNSVKKVVVVVQLRSTLQLHGMHMLGFLSFTVSPSLLKLTSIESMVPSNHLILCCPSLLPPSVFPSIRVFSSDLALLIWWPKDWSFSFRVSLCNEYSGLISFSIDWFDLAPWMKSINYLVLSLLYGPTFTSVHDYWKSHSFLILCLGFSLLPFQGASIFEFHVCSLCPQSDFGAQENKVCHCSHFFPFYLP